jgi:N-acetylglucosamine malate deacetylase 1
MSTTLVLEHITALTSIARAGRSLVATAAAPEYPLRASDAPCVAIVAPHPDDECIVGGLALRLGLDHAWRVVNIAVTHGSDPNRQLARGEELRNACRYLGFETESFGERGLTRVHQESRDRGGAAWQSNVDALVEKLLRLRPGLLLAPHPHDGQGTHVGTYWLLFDALEKMPKDYSPLVALTEYWSTMESPNLMVELSNLHVSQLVSGLLHHTGEITRNPYQASLPLWMMDAVRRGSERVGGSGSEIVDFDFCSLYTLLHWRDGAFEQARNRGGIFPKTRSLLSAFS